MKKWLLPLVVLFTTFVITACPNGDDNNGADPNGNGYLLNIDFNSPPYVLNQNIVTTPATGWAFTGGSVGNHRFTVLPHTHSTVAGDMMAELFMNTSNRQLSIELSDVISRNSGKYLVSFDVQVTYTDLITSSGYNITFSHGDDPVTGRIDAAGIRFFSDTEVTVNNPQNNDGRTRGTTLAANWERWFRVNALIDTDGNTITWTIRSSQDEVVGTVTHPFTINQPLRWFHIRGAGDSSTFRITLDNIRVIKGDTDENPPVWFVDDREQPDPIKTDFVKSRVGMTVGETPTTRRFAWQTPRSFLGETWIEWISYKELVGGQFPQTGGTRVYAELQPYSSSVSPTGGSNAFFATVENLPPNTRFAYCIGGQQVDTETNQYIERSVIWASGVFPFEVQNAQGTLSPQPTADNELGFNFSPPRSSGVPSIALAPVAGNHDADSYLYRMNFNLPNTGHPDNHWPVSHQDHSRQDRSGPSWYFRYQNVIFAHLNLSNLIVRGGIDSLNPAGVDRFFESVFSRHNDAKWRVVVLHFGLYGSSTNHSNVWYTLDMRNALSPIFSKHNIDVVLNGHCHTFACSNMMLHNRVWADQIANSGGPLPATMTDVGGATDETYGVPGEPLAAPGGAADTSGGGGRSGIPERGGRADPTWGYTIPNPEGTVFMTFSGSTGIRLNRLQAGNIPVLQPHLAARRAFMHLLSAGAVAQYLPAGTGASVTRVTVTGTVFRLETFLTLDLLNGGEPFDWFEVRKTVGPNVRLTRPIPPVPTGAGF